MYCLNLVSNGLEPGSFEFPTGTFPTIYTALFIVGIIAHNGDWFSKVSKKTGKRFSILATILALILPIALMLGGC